MPGPAHGSHYTLAEYLAFEASSNVKHEFLDGQIYAMAGGTPEHGALAAAAIFLLFSQLRAGRCRPLDSDVRVRVRKTGLTTYPDVSVVRGPRELDVEDDQAVVNPTLLVEVLSRSTEDYDRGEKFEHYKAIDTLRQYVLVSQSERCVEVWTRAADGTWARHFARDGERARLDSIGAELDVRELYEAAAEPSA